MKFTISIPRESCTNAKAKYSSSVVPPDPSVHFYHCSHLLLSAVLRRRCLWASGATAVNRFLLPARTAPSSKPAARLRSHDGTEGRAHGRFIDTAPNDVRASSTVSVICSLSRSIEKAQPFLSYTHREYRYIHAHDSRQWLAAAVYIMFCAERHNIMLMSSV